LFDELKEAAKRVDETLDVEALKLKAAEEKEELWSSNEVLIKYITTEGWYDSSLYQKEDIEGLLRYTKVIYKSGDYSECEKLLKSIDKNSELSIWLKSLNGLLNARIML